ncbi:MAG: hypothetical protein WBO69_09025, partial [Thermoanaerobaculia bacterium]
MKFEPERVPFESHPQATPQPNTPQRKKNDFLLGEPDRLLDRRVTQLLEGEMGILSPLSPSRTCGKASRMAA